MLVAIASLAIPLMPAPASATNGNYPWFYRMDWRPTYGHVETGTPGIIWPKYVSEDFKWGTWVAMTELDSPRTPYHTGSYEHELRFQLDSNNLGWCDSDAGMQNEFFDLPADSYHDTIGTDVGEFTWGMQAWRLTQNHIYDIYFECFSSSDGTNSFNLTGQIGDCPSSPCNSGNTWADETTRLVPRRIGTITGTHTWGTSFASERSFESGLAPWTPYESDLQWVCGDGTAYEGDCWGRVVPDSGASTPRIAYDETPGNPAMGTASLVHEAVVRCPAYSSVNCTLRVHIRGWDASGNQTDEQMSPWATLVPGSGWYNIGLHSNSWPSATVKWTFRIESNGARFNVDYNMQTWHLPQ